MPVSLLFTGFTRHPKLRRAGPLAGWLFVCMLEYCAEFGTDGLVPDEAIDTFGVKGSKQLLAKLQYGDDMHGPLIHRTGGRWEVNDYLDWNEHAAVLAEKQRAKSEARSKAGSKGAAKRWGTGRLHDKPDSKPDGKPIANGIANGSQADSSSPSPSSSSGLESPSSAVDRREPPRSQADPEISERQQQAITDLASQLRTFRPQWDQPQYEAQITRLVKSTHQHPWPRVVIAMVAIAADHETKTPQRVHLYPDGYWWNDQDTRTQAALTRWVAAGHPNPMQALVR
jgi:hypothetical protein